jgi:plastocyanin
VRRAVAACAAALGLTFASMATGARAAVPVNVPAGDSVVTVHIRDNVFVPSSVTITRGTTVRWVNDGRNRHDVTPDAGDAFGSRVLRPGQSYTHAFDDAGTFAYYCSIHGAPGVGQIGEVSVARQAAAGGAAPVGAGAAPAPAIPATGRTIRVPADAPTIQRAVDRARPGDLVLVSPGVYREAVTIATDGVVLRGVDRNRTILDGQHRRANGVRVLGANGVAIENLTARNYTENGFFWSGVLGYRGSYLTAYRNGDYGIYAFDSQWGQFDHSYASGSPDAGFYIGQCDPCHALVTDVVSEHNQLGYSGTNSSGDLLIVRSTWRRNRAGIVPNSLSDEQLPPQGRATIVGNAVYDNGTADAAVGNEGFDVIYGVGIALIGTEDNLVVRNRVEGSASIGIGIAPTPGIGGSFYAASGNQVRDNAVSGSGRADLGIIPADADDANCFAENAYRTSAPLSIEQVKPCAGAPSGDPNAGALDIRQFLDTSKNPKGLPYARTPVPGPRSGMPRAARAPAAPAGAPVMPALDAITTPPEGYRPPR